MNGRKQCLKQHIVEIITGFKREPKECSFMPGVVMANLELAEGYLGLMQARGDSDGCEV